MWAACTCSKFSSPSKGPLGWGVGWWKVLVTEERLLQVENQKIMIIKAKARVCLLLISRMWAAVFPLKSNGLAALGAGHH